MKAKSLISQLVRSGVDKSTANDLGILDSVIDRIVSHNAWQWRRDKFFFRTLLSVTIDKDLNGSAGARVMKAGAGHNITTAHLGYEFELDGTFIELIGVDGNDLHINAPLPYDVINKRYTFKRRKYMPKNSDNIPLGLCRNPPSNVRDGETYYMKRVTNSESDSEKKRVGGWRWTVASYIEAPYTAPQVSNAIVGGGIAESGDYNVYYAYRIGDRVSPLSPPTRVTVPPATPDYQITITGDGDDGKEIIYVIEGPMSKTDHCNYETSDSGLRIVSNILYPARVNMGERYCPTYDSMCVEYGSPKEEETVVFVEGYTKHIKISSVDQEVQLPPSAFEAVRAKINAIHTNDPKFEQLYAFHLRALRQTRSRL